MFEILDITSHIEENLFHRYRGTVRPNFSFLASYFKKKYALAWFWENHVFVKDS